MKFIYDCYVSFSVEDDFDHRDIGLFSSPEIAMKHLNDVFPGLEWKVGSDSDGKYTASAHWRDGVQFWIAVKRVDGVRSLSWVEGLIKNYVPQLGIKE